MQARLLRVYGIVQGVGFRPFVARLATREGICGSVANKGSYVEIMAEGEAGALARFQAAVRTEAPERAAVIELTAETAEPQGAAEFVIAPSEFETGAVFVSPDIATCPRCEAELFDKKDRRYLHPFINCTACGPRLTILEEMPYDRERTSMKEFPMCEACRGEYENPESRRYDAQPVACHDCGPRVYVLGGGEDSAITAVRQVLADGGIAAVKGIGGFHLCCDAFSEKAVARLRELKHRPAKPFAVMARDLAAAQAEVEISAEAEEIICGPKKPILLLRRKKDGKIAQAVAPDNDRVGVMLPYAPLHYLLFSYPDGLDEKVPRALVMTSGNPSGAPLCRTDEEAEVVLGRMSDIILSHDRKIRLRADDSVLDFAAGRPTMVRRSRGYAPLPFHVAGGWRGEVLGIGGELKNTFCLGKDELFYPSAYIGDMSDVRTVAALEEAVPLLSSLLEIRPQAVACDLHPRYNTTAVAERMGISVLKVQHHYAHILSCMAENDYTEPVIGLALDGTGYGTDGTVWGGELLRADLHGFERLGSIAPFCQAGGDRSSREGWRIAVNLLYAATGDEAETLETAARLGLGGAASGPQAQLFMEKNKVNAVQSTSTGRLFDAVSAVLGLRQSVSFEGEAAMLLEYRARLAGEAVAGRPPCDPYGASGNFTMRDGRFILPTTELFGRIVERRLAGEDVGALAYAFHAELAAMLVAGAERAAEQTGLRTVALSGGTWQNQLLLGMVVTELEAKGYRVLVHRLCPPNDGGLALGQALYAMENFR